MPLLRLSDELVDQFAKIPEAAMDLHVLHGERDANGQFLGFVIGCAILMIPDDDAREEISVLLQEGRTIWRGTSDAAIRAFEGWRTRLRSASEWLGVADARLAHMVVQRHHLVYRPLPAVPPGLYGHLPFVGTTLANEIFYRCECWPVSRRVDLTNRKVLAGTFAFPASELPLVPSGFAAVGRYALPDLPPACTRYELHPPSGTQVDCGASVPLFGQAGGGVEVCFRSDFVNDGAIANPILLPVM